MGAPAQHTQTRNPHIIKPSVGSNQGWLETSTPRYGPNAAEQIKAQIALEDVIGEVVALQSAGKGRLRGLCPFHAEKTPSFHVETDKQFFYCFGCSANGDVFDFVMQTQNLEFRDALKLLSDRIGGSGSYLVANVPKRAAPPAPTKSAYTAVEASVLEVHRRRAAQLTKGPKSLSGRGFTLHDLRRLGIAADGDDAVLPITGPAGAVFALKRRYAAPHGNMRYVYDTPGHGTPAWCSPGFLEADEALVVEGELNGMTSWLARRDLGVMGVAGTYGAIYGAALAGKQVYVYADGDAVGEAARGRWAQVADQEGAARVYLLEPWDMDACDVAGKFGRDELRRRLS